jgi:hypothetical protein
VQFGPGVEQDELVDGNLDSAQVPHGQVEELGGSPSKAPFLPPPAISRHLESVGCACQRPRQGQGGALRCTVSLGRSAWGLVKNPYVDAR